MKVSFVTDSWLDRDGYGTFLSSYVSYFRIKGHEVRVFSEHVCGHSQDTSLSQLSLSTILDSLLESDGPSHCSNPDGSSCESGLSDAHCFLFESDIVIVAFLTYYPLMEVVRFLARNIVVFLYPGITPYTFYPDFDPMRQFTKDGLSHLGMLQYGDGVIVNSQYMASELEQLSSIERARISVIPLESKFDIRKECAAQDSLVMNEPPFRLLYVGRLGGNKNIEFLVHALAEMRSRGLDVELVIAGMFQRTFCSQYMSGLKELAVRLKMETYIEFVDSTSDDELEALYGSADILVTASHHEGFCLPVAEAMSFGVPCIVPDCTATPETMGEGGITYKPDSIDSFVSGAQKLLCDNALYEEKSRSALEEAQRFSRPAFIRSLDDFFSALQKEERQESTRRIEIAGAVAHHSEVYRDSFSFPLVGRFVRWFRRKLSFPLEKSVVRPLVKQQSLWNKLAVEELKELRSEVNRLQTAVDVLRQNRLQSDENSLRRNNPEGEFSDETKGEE